MCNWTGGLLIVLVASATLSACARSGGTATGEPTPATAAARPAAGGSFAVRMQPDKPLEQGLKSSSLLSPDRLPVLPLSGHGTSAATDQLSLDATAYEPALPSSRIEAHGDYLVFFPQWSNAATDSLDSMSFASYRLDLSNYAGLSTLNFEWADKGAPRFEGKYWIGVSNYSKGRWDWFSGPLDEVLTVASFADYCDQSGSLLLVVAVLHKENIVALRHIYVGQPEARGTGGLDDTEVDLVTQPPLFAADLPPSVDISAGCAPVGDQGSWNCCTAFAIGQGALNYELKRIYAAYGWDHSDPFNLISPDYLYVESGKLQGVSPGTLGGRNSRKVAEGLVSHGVASELNAPWDLVYADDWNSEALADAEILRAQSNTMLPCTTPEGIRTIKTILAYQRRPVWCITGVDQAFFNYYQGQVWNFTGPWDPLESTCRHASLSIL